MANDRPCRWMDSPGSWRGANHVIEEMTVPVTTELTRKHYSRLRQYWQAGRLGLTSTGDGIALDLTAAGYLEVTSSGGGLKLIITQAGIEELQAESEREKTRRRPHHDLAGRLAAWLREQGRVTWENIELLVPHAEGGRQAIRPDVFSLAATYDAKRLNPCVHEVKVSRSDFLADVGQPEKRAGYSQVAEVVYYAAPDGMIEANEVPTECGLLVESKEGQFKVVKRPKKQRVELTAHHFMNLILKQGSLNPL